MLHISHRCALLLALLLPMLLLTSCRRSGQDVWDDTKTCGRHMARGLRSLTGCQSDSRQVCSRHEFMPSETSARNTERSPYLPLPEEYLSDELAMVEYTGRRAKESANRIPNDSSTPSVESFRNPSSKENWRGIFPNIRFPYNSDLVKGSDNLAIIRKIGSYLKQHPSVHLLIEGHCDERGAEAYNLALGLRRAHTVRTMLLKEGVNPLHLQTVSFGKERPIELASNEEAWGKNRRAEFKVYE